MEKFVKDVFKTASMSKRDKNVLEDLIVRVGLQVYDRNLRIARKVTEESKQWAKDTKAKARNRKNALKEYVSLWRELKALGEKALKLYPVVLFKDEKGKEKEDPAIAKSRRNWMRERMEELSSYHQWVDRYFGTNDMDPQISSLKKSGKKKLIAIGLKGTSASKGWKYIAGKVEEGYQIKVMTRVQSRIRKEIPESVRKFLPKNIVIDVDKDGNIEKITDRFVNEYETMSVKRQRQKSILEGYSKIVAQVKKDIRSNSPSTRMAAIVTAIIMETGIRPGQPGNEATIRVEGKKVKVPTFGATTLQIKHLKNLRKDMLTLDFTGKMASRNIAEVGNQELIRVIKSFVKKAVKDLKEGGKSDSKYLFTFKDGKNFNYDMLRRYFKRTAALSKFKVTDFRKIKATRTVLQNLKNSQEDLQERIRAAVEAGVENLKERVAEEIATVVNNAYTGAQSALSHDKVETTIRAYVNPEVLLRYLSEGGVEDTLEKTILQGRNKLAFDIDKFIEKAMSGSSPKTAFRVSKRRFASFRLGGLESLLKDLERDIDEVKGDKIAATLESLLEQVSEGIKEGEEDIQTFK